MPIDVSTFPVKPSHVKLPIFDSVWQNSERETVASNIRKLAVHRGGDCWTPFTWEDYRAFCSHSVSSLERAILDQFARTGYLTKSEAGVYGFTPKIIGVYMQFLGDPTDDQSVTHG